MCNCGGAAEHEHGLDEVKSALCAPLNAFIDMRASSVLNVTKDSAPLAHILRPRYLSQAESTEVGHLFSDTDPQLLVKLQFTGSVKIKALTVRSRIGYGPSEMRAFLNSPTLDFAAAETASPTQSWFLVDERNLGKDDIITYPTKVFKFQNVNHLTLFFPTNHGDDPQTVISFIGLYGEFQQNRIGVVEATYESKPMLADHKSETDRWKTSFQPGF